MKKALVVTLAMLVLAAWTILPADANGRRFKAHNFRDGGDDRHDFAIFDGTNPANQGDGGVANPDPVGVAGAICGTRLRGQPFTFHLSVTNHVSGTAGFVRITYADGDFVQFPINPDATLQITQAAGSRSGNDQAIRVSGVPGGTGGSTSRRSLTTASVAAMFRPRAVVRGRTRRRIGVWPPPPLRPTPLRARRRATAVRATSQRRYRLRRAASWEAYRERP